MIETVQSPYPLIFIQYQLQGGRKRFLGTVLIYAVLTIGVVFLFRRIASDLTWNELCGHLLRIIAYVQCGVAMLGAPNMIHRALLRDFQSHMMDSHRLSPMSRESVVLGYLVGGPLQSLLLYALNVLFGLALIGAARVPLMDWLVGNGLLLAGAIALWSLLIFLGVGRTKPVGAVGLVIIIGMTARLLVMLVPGAGLLFGAYSSGSAVMIMLGGTSPGTSAIALMTLAGLAFGAFWLHAAAARFRRPDLPALNAVRGSLLLLLWLVASTLGMSEFQRVSRIKAFGFLAGDATLATTIQWFTAIGGAALISLIPLHASATLNAMIRGGSHVRGRADRVPDWLLTFLLPMMILGLLALLALDQGCTLLDERSSAGGGSFDAQAIRAAGCTLAALIMANVTFVALTRINLARSKPKRSSITALVLLILWLLPSAFDIGRAAYQQTELTWLFGCSPVGTLILSWTALEELGGLNVSCLPGLSFQILTTFILVALARWIRLHPSDGRFSPVSDTDVKA